MALGMSVGRLGSTSNNLLMPVIAGESSLGTALLFGLSLIVMSYVLGLILLGFETKALATEPSQANLDEEPETVN